MSAMAILGFALPTLAAWLVLDRYWPGRTGYWPDRLMQAALAWPLAAGFGSAFYFLWALLFTPSGRMMVWVETALLAVVIVVLTYLLIKRRLSRSSEAPWEQDALNRSGRSLRRDVIPTIAIVATGVAAVFAFVNFLFRNPHGLWDAWAIWNLRARFLYRSAEHWTNTFSDQLFWSSPDYPLCLPGMVARCWKYAGNESVWVPMLAALLFSAATALLLGASLARLSGTRGAALGVVALLGTPLFMRHGASQYADIPLAFFFLATVVLLSIYARDGHRRWLVMAGTAASLAVWTKNEGLVFLLAVAVVAATLGARTTGRRRLLSNWGPLLAGAAPALGLLIVFKAFFAPADGFFSIQDTAAIWDKLTDPARYWTVLQAFGRQILFYGDGMALAMVGLLVLAWPPPKAGGRRNLAPGLVILAVMIAAYFVIYIITPQNLSWHLRTSIHRVLLQLWPTALFVFVRFVVGDREPD